LAVGPATLDAVVPLGAGNAREVMAGRRYGAPVEQKSGGPATADALVANDAVKIRLAVRSIAGPAAPIHRGAAQRIANRVGLIRARRRHHAACARLAVDLDGRAARARS